MADENTVTEKLELHLGYGEFISGLRNVTNAYHSAIDNINNMGSSVGKALVQSSRLVQNTINGLSVQTANFVKEAFGTVQTNLDNTHNSVRKLSAQISKDLREIEKLTQQKVKIKTEGEAKASSLEKVIGKSPEISTAQAQILRQTLAAETASKIAAVEAQISEKTSKMYKGMTDLGLNAAKSLTTTTEKASSSILQMNKEAISSLNNVYKTSGVFAKDIESVYAGRQVVDQIKSQRQTLSQQLIAIDQQRVSSQHALELTRVAMNKQANEAMHKDAVLSHAKAVTELNKVTDAQKRAITYEKELGESLASAYGRLPEILKSLKGNTEAASVAMKQDIGTIGKAFDEMFSHVVKSMSIFGKLGSGDIKEYFSMFTRFRTEINKNVEVIDEMIRGLQKIKNVDPGIRHQITDLQNMRDRFVNLKKSIDDTVTTTEKLNFSGPLKQSQDTLSKFSSQFSRLSDEIRKEKKGFRGEDFSSQLGISQGLQHWKNIKTYSEQMRTLLKNIRKEISDQEAAQSRIEIEITRTDNETKKKLYRSYVDSVKQYIGELQARLEIYGKEFTGGRKLRDILVSNSEAFKESIKDQRSGWKTTIATLDQMKSKYEEVRSYASKWGSSNREAAQKGKDDLHKQAESYIEVKQRIQEAIKSLHTLAKSKDLNFNATETINELGRMLRTMNTTMPQIRSMMAGSTKFVDAQMRAASKSWYTLGWEYIRNFRWQVAGVLYLTQSFVRGVENYFVNALKKVDEFRKGVYSLTATTGLSFGKEFGANYNEIYAYSTNLAEKLQLKASESYASLEDLMMVTRSFAQSGIFPKSTEDIERVNTLATAVKVMTEGMANAGVQMRQEIMALIEGRQRVTDSVALAFRMQGIDIKKEMDNWAREGKSKLQGFAELLEPFARVNKEINKELGTQINHLKTTWDYVQRIALTKLTLNVAEELNRFSLSLRDKTGELTELGKSWVKGISAGFQIFWQLVKSVWEVIKEVSSIIWNVFEAIGSLVTPFAALDTSMSNWGQSVYVVLRYMMALEFAVVTILSPVRMFSLWIKGIAYDISAICRLLTGDFKGAWEDLGKSGQAWIESFKAYPEYLGNYEKRLQELQKNVKELDKSITNVGKTQETNTEILFGSVEAQTLLNKAAGEFQDIYEKNRNKEQKASETLSDMKDKYQSAMKAGQESIDKTNQYIVNATNWGISETQKVGMEAINQSLVASNAISNSVIGTTNLIVQQHGIAGVVFTSVDENSAASISSMSATLSNAVVQDCENAKSAWQSFVESMSISWAGIKGFISGALTVGQEAGSEAIKAMDAKRTELAESNKQSLKSSQDVLRTAGLVGPTVINASIDRGKKDIEKTTNQMMATKELFDKASKAVVEKAAGGGGTKKTLLDMYDEYMGLLDRFGSIDPFQKITYDYWKHLADIDKAAQENSVVRSHYEELVGKAQQYWLDQLEQKRNEVEKNTVDFYRKIYDIDASPMQKITEKFKDLVSEINANKNLDEGTKNWLKSLIPANEALAKQNQLRKEQIELEQKWMEVSEAHAKYLDLSVSTTDKQTASAMRLETEYRKWVLTQQEALRNAEKLATIDPENYGEAYRQQRQIFEESNYWMKASLDEQLNEVWNPFYKDLKEMQQGWADSISSTMTDILFDAKDWKTKISDLFKSISKEIINAFIKRNVVEPFLNQFNDIGKGGILGKLFGTEKKETESGTTTESTGIMSYVNKALNFFGLGTKSEEATKGILSGYSFMNPLPVVVTNMSGSMGGGEGGGGFLSSITGSFSSLFSGGESKSNDSISQAISSLSGLSSSAINTTSSFGEVASSGDNLASSFMSNASSIASSISNMLSSMGSSGGGGSIFSSLGSMFGSSGGSSSFAMAEGGEIKEPIFGVGLKSGATYTLGEKEDELVTPMSKVRAKGNVGINSEPIQTNTFVNFHMNAIDSKTGTEFLVKHSDVLQGVIAKAVKGNKSIRKDIKNSY